MRTLKTLSSTDENPVFLYPARTGPKYRLVETSVPHLWGNATLQSIQRGYGLLDLFEYAEVVSVTITINRP